MQFNGKSQTLISTRIRTTSLVISVPRRHSFVNIPFSTFFHHLIGVFFFFSFYVRKAARVLESEDLAVIKTEKILMVKVKSLSGAQLVVIFYFLCFLVFFVIMQAVNLFHQRFSFRLLPEFNRTPSAIKSFWLSNTLHLVFSY